MPQRYDLTPREVQHRSRGVVDACTRSKWLTLAVDEV
jgi:hypothetical protein